ncbi:flagellin [Sulfurivermis fontis]|uniref:flagellin N-terminal helical domain-containing protein n=1 Tax=Sulfurivermis fontis TaxID=1972068 RepID=UPI000FDCA2AF|nr:flagellin [Sulfurivermis fontis]
MPQIINTNMMSLNSQRNLNTSQNALQISLQRLSSGLRINSAKDDAAGLAISERFTTQIRGLNQAVRNANDGISFAQTAEGALSTVGNALQRIRELAVQSANDTNSASDRQALQNEVSQLIAEVNRVSAATEFNGQKILDGSLSNLVFQVGANRNQTITVDGVDARGSQLGAAVLEGNSVTLSDITGVNDGTAIAAGDFSDVTINGVSVDLSTATSLDEVVAAINGEYGATGVQAVRSQTVTTDELAFVTPSAGESMTVSINGVAISVAAGDAVTDFIDAINARTNQTGVTAEAGAGGTFVLSSNADITIEVATADDTASVAGLADGEQETYLRGIELNAEVGTTITVAGTDVSTLQLDNDFGGNPLATVDYTLNAVDITTRDGATEALRTLDLALQQVSGLRSELGAVQVRFESTISNLSVSAENMTAARSRIQDADFAVETANLTRAQILQQAGVAMLAQANQLPQNVLSLLR